MNGDPDHQDVYVSRPNQQGQEPVGQSPQPVQNQPVYTPLTTTPAPMPPQTHTQDVPAQQTPTPPVVEAQSLPTTPASSFAPPEIPRQETPPAIQQQTQSYPSLSSEYSDSNETIKVPDRTPSLSEMRKNKQRTTLGIVVSVAGIILLAALGVSLDRRATSQTTSSEETQIQTAQETSTATQDEIVRKEIVQLVEGVISITENTHYELTLQYFLYGEGERLRENDIIDSLEFIEGTYKRSDDTFNILTSTERTRLVDNNAQVLVDFVGNDIYPVRFDLEKRNDEWKITFITFGGKLNL